MSNSIPASWEKVRLGQIARISSGGTPSRAIPEYWNGKIPWITTSKINFRVVSEAEEFISELGLKNSAAKVLPKGTLLMAMYGQGATRGRVGILGLDAAINQACASIELADSVLSDFLFYFLAYNYEPIRKLGHGGNQANLNSELIRSIEILLPPYKEQIAISEILRAWDFAISQSEKLILVKDTRKRGLMQQLLTGKRRFSTCTVNDWAWLTLGEVASESRVRNNGTIDSNDLMAVTKARGMVPMRERVQGDSVERCKVVSKDWFAYNPMRLNIGSIAKWEGDKDVLVSPDYVVFRCDETRLDPDFLNHFRRTRQWSNFVERSGDGSVRVRIYFSHLASLRMHLPPVEEQRRIAQFLNACEKEIALLKQQLDALKRQKRGLMQKLLTGQIRVKVGQAEVATVEAV
jgi:type I restriction enzyme S subunit